MSTPASTERLSSIRSKLEDHTQGHILAGFDELSPEQQGSLLEQIETLDFDEIDRLIERYVRVADDVELPDPLEPAPYYPAEPGDAYDAEAYRRAGETLVRCGALAVFTVAGGQGTRLGWKGPKGTYPATSVTGKPLFQCFAEQIRAAQRCYGITVPWYIMTSPANDGMTRAFLADNNCFGLERKNIFMFPQRMVPSFDASTARLLVAEAGVLAMNPDGHGGSLRALDESGAIADMRARGVELISYIQIDNPLALAIDPLFVGLHADAPDSAGSMSSKMVEKACPEEKVGVFVRSGDSTLVIEYSDLPEKLARETDDDGHLSFRAGSIAIHMLGVDFVESLNARETGFALPWHRANKIVPYWDHERQVTVEPEEPNSVKLEMFVFDALAFADRSIVLETTREREFAPIKNTHGVDSPATSHQIQSDHYGTWLERAGVVVPRDDNGHVTARIEVSALTAMSAAELARTELPSEIKPGEMIAL